MLEGNINSFLYINPLHPRRHARENFVWNGACSCCKLLYRGRFSKNDHRIAFIGIGNMRHINHAHVHAYTPQNRRPHTSDQYTVPAITRLAGEAVSVSCADGGLSDRDGQFSAPSISDRFSGFDILDLGDRCFHRQYHLEFILYFLAGINAIQANSQTNHIQLVL